MKPGAVSVPIALRDLNNSPVTGATLTCTVSIDGAAFAASTNAATEVGNGDYALALTAAERGTSYTRIKATNGTYTTLVTVTTDEAMRGTDGALLADDYTAPPTDYAKPADVQVTVPEPVFAGTVTFSGTVEAPAVTVNPTLTPEESAKLMGAVAAAAQTVIDALPVAESIPASWVTITEATLDGDGDALGVASVGGSTAAALGMRIEAITAGALMNATTVGNTLGTYALPVEPGHTYTLRFALPGAAMTERTVTVA